MKQCQILLIALVGACLIASSFFLFNPFSEGAPPKSKSLKIGFVNLEQIFREYKKVKVMEQDLNRKMEAELAQLKELEEEAKNLRKELDIFRPGSEVYVQKREELAEIVFQIKHKKDRAEYFFREDMRRGTEETYLDILKEVERYADKKGYSMVLRVSDPEFAESLSEDALRMQISTKNVLFWSEEDDITKTIIKRMNDRYEKGKTSFEEDASESSE